MRFWAEAYWYSSTRCKANIPSGWGLPSRRSHLRRWWSLTPPFHPYPRFRGGGLFSVALSRGSPRVGVTDHPALWSPDLPHRACAKTGPFARNGLSLTRMTSACADPMPGSKILACYFAHSLAGLPARSALWLRRQPLVCPSFRLHPRLKPVAFFTGLLCRLCRLLPLPFRSFRSLGINASAGFTFRCSDHRDRGVLKSAPTC
jgi:hypothetical protein